MQTGILIYTAQGLYPPVFFSIPPRNSTARQIRTRHPQATTGTKEIWPETASNTTVERAKQSVCFLAI
jgi:hypothetical protein